MKEKLKKLLEDFRQNCNGETCDSCELGKDIIMRTSNSEYDFCEVIMLMEQKLEMID